MDLHYKQEVTVGVLVLAGIGLFLAGTMWLKGSSFGGGGDIRVIFPDAGTLKKGSPVKVSGVEVGKVSGIEFLGVGRVQVTVKLDHPDDARVTPKLDAAAKLSSVGLVGDAVVNYDPGAASDPLPPDRVIQGSLEQGLTGLGTDLGLQAKEVMGGIQELANKDLAADLKATLQTMRRTLDVYANTRSGPAAELNQALASLRRLSDRLDSTLVATNLPSTLRKSDTLMTTLSGTSAEFTTTAARFDSLLQRINRGDGTLGKLVTDSLLYGDVRRLTRAAQELIDELRKHPGKITIQVKVF